MGRLHARDPEDPDVASLYALALLGTMSRSLIGTADAHEGHSQALAGSETQKRVEEILGRVLRAHPQHLGALHYLIHNDDDPAHARLALEAARTLTRLAPDSSHARHMPAHIFLQLGRWPDAAAADRSAVAASDAWIARTGLPPAMRNYHALQWLQYELLQLGRYREARATIDELAPVVKATGNVTLLSDLSSMRARYVIETASWPLLAAESNFGNAYELFAIGLSAARSRNRDVASRVVQALGQRAQDPREGDLRPAIAIMQQEVAAIVSLVEGRSDQAVEALRAAASCREPAAGAARIADADQTGAGAARRGAGRNRPAGRGDSLFRGGAAAAPEPLAVRARSRSRDQSGGTGGGVAPSLSRAARELQSR